MKLRYNIMNITSISSFGNIHGRIINDCKDVYFVRCIGSNNSFLSDILSLDQNLSNNCDTYLRINNFPAINDTSLITYYSEKYNAWYNNKTNLLLRSTADAQINSLFNQSCICVCELLKLSHPNYSNTIEKNLIINLMWWTDTLLYQMLKKASSQCCKLICSGKIGYREYLFCYLATLMGIDVMLLLPAGNINLNKCMLDKSYSFVIGNVAEITIPDYHKPNPKPVRSIQQTVPPKKVTILTPPPTPVTIPKPIIQNSNVPPMSIINTPLHNSKSSTSSLQPEMRFEELAQLGSSVVMIAIENNFGNIIGSGSGIAINSNGYILTNCHVANKGKQFAVRIENDDNIYQTSDVIKYHPMLDLAIIRINRQLKPLKIYSKNVELVRGQKVVAIGSPLGLFNSVSDGIISGFRMVNEMNMIQFTAPISSGSSGGAVLNMYGEVIGISTAGIDGGQNINLAVSYKQILPFINGFI